MIDQYDNLYAMRILICVTVVFISHLDLNCFLRATDHSGVT